MILGDDFVWCTTSTSGTGAFTTSAAVSAAYRPFSVFPNGTEIRYIRSDSAGSFEERLGTVNTSGGVTTITPVGSPLLSSNSGAAVNWAAGGTQNVRCGPGAGSYMTRQNYLAEISADGQGDLACSYLGAATDAVRGLSGGTNGRVVRESSAGTVTDAFNTDTSAQLVGLLFKQGGKYYRYGEMITLSGLTAGSSLWLGTSSAPLLTSAPSSGISINLGMAYSSTLFLFTPTRDITASVPSGSKLAFYNSAAPSGWTLLTSIDDTVMCLTNNSGFGGGGPHAGGSTGGVGWDASVGMTVAAHALTAGEIPCSLTAAAGSAVLAVSNVIPSVGHTHTLSSAQTWRPTSAYFILCSKN